MALKGCIFHIATCFVSSPALPATINVPFLRPCDRLWLEWLVLGLNTVSMGPLLFLWHVGSHWDEDHCSHFWWPSVCAAWRVRKTLCARFSFPFFFLMCSSKHPLLVRGPSKGQHAVTSQKLDSWLQGPAEEEKGTEPPLVFFLSLLCDSSVAATLYSAAF